MFLALEARERQRDADTILSMLATGLAPKQVFFMPMRMIRGQAVPNQKEGIVDFAWLTKEEIKDKVSDEYWQAVEPILSDQ